MKKKKGNQMKAFVVQTLIAFLLGYFVYAYYGDFATLGYGYLYFLLQYKTYKRR